MRIAGFDLARDVGFEILHPFLADEIEKNLTAAVKNGVVFENDANPLEIFRGTIASSIGKILQDEKSQLLIRLLRDGPSEYGTEIPPDLIGRRLSTKETATALSFISGKIVYSFQGAIAELLALGPCFQILVTLKQERTIPINARLFVGDAVKARQLKNPVFAKCADMHFLEEHRESQKPCLLRVHAVVEVKSYLPKRIELEQQFAKHEKRSLNGLRLRGIVYSSGMIKLEPKGKPLRICVLPSQWKLPREFSFADEDGRSFLKQPAIELPAFGNVIERRSSRRWNITLRWSQEMIAASAYEMSFWFLGKLGEELYREGVPAEWSEMSPQEAGRNAATMQIYYAIRPYEQRLAHDETLSRAEKLEMQRAIALYNTYGFGYALGMNFKDAKKRRRMLWVEDLRVLEKNKKKKTDDGCRIWL